MDFHGLGPRAGFWRQTCRWGQGLLGAAGSRGLRKSPQARRIDWISRFPPSENRSSTSILSSTPPGGWRRALPAVQVADGDEAEVAVPSFAPPPVLRHPCLTEARARELLSGWLRPGGGAYGARGAPAARARAPGGARGRRRPRQACGRPLETPGMPGYALSQA